MSKLSPYFPKITAGAIQMFKKWGESLNRWQVIGLTALLGGLIIGPSFGGILALIIAAGVEALGGAIQSGGAKLFLGLIGGGMASGIFAGHILYEEQQARASQK